MQNRETTAAPADALVLRDKALNLREAVNSSRARMSAQRETILRLRADISALRALVESRPAQPARWPAASPAPLPAAPAPGRSFVAPISRRPPPVVKETVPDSAPETISFKTSGPARARTALPYAAILAFAVAVQLRPAAHRDAGIPLTAAVPAAPSPSPIAPADAAEDDGAEQALLLAHEHRLPGDEKPLAERLNSGTNPPGSRPAWTAERTGERAYRVSYQPSDADVSYDFDVDLDARRVDPTPETAELIAPRLASRR